MPFYNDNQKTTNVYVNDDLAKSPGDALLLQVPFSNCVTLYRQGDEWYARYDVVDSDGSGDTEIVDAELPQSGSGQYYYEPDFVCRAISINDADSGGEEVLIDMPYRTRVSVRLYAGEDRLVRVTKVYLNDDSDKRDILLWG